MVYFPNCTIEIYEPVESEEYDKYTGEPKDKWELVTSLRADFQRMTNDEDQEEWGKDIKDRFKIYVPLNTPVTHKSVIKVKSDFENRTFDVIGVPQYWNRFHMFRKIIVQVQRRAIL